MGRGMGKACGCCPCPYIGISSRKITPEEEKSYLEEEKKALQEEMEAIDERIKEL